LGSLFHDDPREADGGEDEEGVKDGEKNGDGDEEISILEEGG